MNRAEQEMIADLQRRVLDLEGRTTTLEASHSVLASSLGRIWNMLGTIRQALNPTGGVIDNVDDFDAHANQALATVADDTASIDRIHP